MSSIPFLGRQDYQPTRIQVESAKFFVNKISFLAPSTVEKILLVAIPILLLFIPISFGPALLSSSTPFLSKIFIGCFCVILTYPGFYLYRQINIKHERFNVIKKLYPLLREDVAQDPMIFRRFHPINRSNR